MPIDQTPQPRWDEPVTVGIHNSDLDQSRLRILQGGGWKKQDTVIVLPASKTVPTKAALSWMNLLTPPNQSAPKIGAIGLEVGEAYSNVIAGVLEHPQLKGHKYLLTIEHDNIPPQDGLLRLLAHMEAHPEFDCISGLYWTKGPMGVPQIWGDAKDPLVNFRPQPPEPNGGLVECCGTGMGFAVWRTDLFRDPRLRRPWFKTTCAPGEGVGTQDLYFWSDARKYGHRCAVACDVLVGHYDVDGDVIW